MNSKTLLFSILNRLKVRCNGLGLLRDLGPLNPRLGPLERLSDYPTEPETTVPLSPDET